MADYKTPLFIRILRWLVEFVVDLVEVAWAIFLLFVRLAGIVYHALRHFIARLIQVERRIRSYGMMLRFPLRWLRYTIYHFHVLPPWVKMAKLLIVLGGIVVYLLGSYIYRYQEIQHYYAYYYPKFYAQLIAKKLPPEKAKYTADYYANFYAEYFTSDEYKEALQFALPVYSAKTVAYPKEARNAPLNLTVDGITLIKEFEGLVQEPYLDVGGKLTVGYGHLVRPNEFYTLVSEAEAEKLLREDIRVAEAVIKRQVKVKLNPYQYAALVSLVYNIGSGHFEHSTLLDKLNDGDYAETAEQFMRWIHVDGRKIRGLSNRRVAERELFLRPSI